MVNDFVNLYFTEDTHGNTKRSNQVMFNSLCQPGNLKSGQKGTEQFLNAIYFRHGLIVSVVGRARLHKS